MEELGDILKDLKKALKDIEKALEYGENLKSVEEKLKVLEKRMEIMEFYLIDIRRKVEEILQVIENKGFFRGGGVEVFCYE